MNKANKIVRTKTTNGSKKKPEEMYYEIDFMTFEKYIGKSKYGYTYADYEFELYPYKWYDIRWIYQIPSYWLLLRIFRNSPERINRQTHKKTSTITLIIEMLLAIKPVIEFIKLFIPES